MKTLCIKILIFLFFCFSLNAAESLKFAPLPMQDKKAIFNDFHPFVEYLEKKLNTKVEIVFYESYDELIKNFENGSIDLAYLGPLPYVKLKEEFPAAIPIVYFKNSIGQTFYTCSLVASSINPKREKIALTQPLSTCGYLSVNALLDKKLENYKFEYLGRHDLVALNVLGGKYDIGGVKSDIAKKYYHLGLDEIKVTKPLPMFALIGNTQKLSKNSLYEITNALIYVDQSELNTWGEPIKYGAKKAHDSEYDPIRKMQENIQIAPIGNIQ